MEVKSIKKNLFLNMIYQGITVFTPIITTPYIARVIGAKGIGEYSYTLAIVSYFTVFGLLGSATYGQLLIAKNRDDEDKRSRIFFTVFYSRVFTMLLSFGLYLIFISWQKDYVKLYIVLFIYYMAQLIDISWFFQGLEEFRVIVPRNIFAKILSVLLVFLLVKKSTDLYLYITILQGAVLVANFSLWPLLIKRIKFKKIDIYSLVINIRENIIYFVPTIATIIFTSLDKCMIEWITHSAYENGYYEQANKITSSIITMITALSVVMLPRMATLWEKRENQQTIKNFIAKSLNYICIFSFPIGIGLFATSEEFIPVFLGKGYEPCINLLRVFSIMLIFTCFNSIISNLCMVARGQQKRVNLLLIVSSTINVLGNVFLILKFASLGAAIASLISESVLLSLIIKENYNDIPLKEWKLYLKKYVLLSICMIPFIVFIKRLDINSLGLKLILEITVGGGVYVLLLLFSKDALVTSVTTRAIDYLKVKRR